MLKPSAVEKGAGSLHLKTTSDTLSCSGVGRPQVFVEMFDEVDEGSATHKVSDKSPSVKHIANYDGMGSDWYLKLTGRQRK